MHQPAQSPGPRPLRATSVVTGGECGGTEPFDTVVLAHDERHLRRKLLTLAGGTKVLVDLPQAVALGHGDCLVLEDGRHARIEAAREALYAVAAPDRLHLTELAWHLGNRHQPAQIEANRVLILRDHVIRDMLETLGAEVKEVIEPFMPVRGAYHGDGHGHTHHHHHDARHHAQNET